MPIDNRHICISAVLLNSNNRKLIKSTFNEVDSSSTHYKIITKVRMEINHSPICSEAERVDQYLAVDGDVARNRKKWFSAKTKNTPDERFSL